MRGIKHCNMTSSKIIAMCIYLTVSPYYSPQGLLAIIGATWRIHFGSWKVIKANGLIKNQATLCNVCLWDTYSLRPNPSVINVSHKTHNFFSSSEIRCTVQYTADFIDTANVCHSDVWGSTVKTVIVFFALGAKCCYMCNIEGSEHKSFRRFPAGLCDWAVEARQFHSAGQRVRRHLNASLDMLNTASFWEVFLSTPIIVCGTEAARLVRTPQCGFVPWVREA